MNKKHFTMVSIVLLQAIYITSAYFKELVDYNKKDVRYIKVDIDKDGEAGGIRVVTGELESGQDVCILSVKDGEELPTKALLIDYDISRNLSLVKICPNLDPSIGVGYGTGAHGYALTLLGITNNNMYWISKLHFGLISLLFR